jgi:hypothetical protein
MISGDCRRHSLWQILESEHDVVLLDSLGGDLGTIDSAMRSSNSGMLVRVRPVCNHLASPLHAGYFFSFFFSTFSTYFSKNSRTISLISVCSKATATLSLVWSSSGSLTFNRFMQVVFTHVLTYVNSLSHILSICEAIGLPSILWHTQTGNVRCGREAGP